MTNLNSPIQWTDVTWSPIVGCDRVSAGCDHCYAATVHNRRYLAWKRGTFPTAPAQYHQPFWGAGGGVQLMPERLDAPRHWRKPRRVFVNSVSDLFHPDVPGEFINQVWNTMFNVKRHTYQILTKRPERLLEWTQRKAAYTHWPIEDIWPSWIWLGVSVENQRAADERIPLLLQTPAAVRFLSCEPLIGPVSLSRYIGAFNENVTEEFEEAHGWRYDAWSGGFIGSPRRGSIPYDPRCGLDWCIVGGESGAHARPMDLSWAESLVEQCRDAEVAVFVKQLGQVWARANSTKERHAGDPAEWPEHLRVREWPRVTGEVTA